jgi:hypothetical protein
MLRSDGSSRIPKETIYRFAVDRYLRVSLINDAFDAPRPLFQVK